MFAKPLVTVLGSATIALMASISGMSTAVADTPGYWSTKSGEVWRTGYGECWRTQFWKPENAIAECEGIADSDGDGIADDKDNCPHTPAGVAVNGNGCELDSDGDGVVDSKDNCSGTAADTNVDASGCKQAESDSDGDGVVDSKDRCSNTSAGARVNSSGCEVDSDSDGVADSQDRCPSSPAGIRVDASGCERDSDGDGIVDSQDSCSSSRSGEKVDAQGCKLEEKIVLKGVNFQTSSDALAGSSFSSLDEIAATLNRYSSMKVEVAGYTDNRGAVSYNQSLSQQRAEAVVDYLVSKGVPATNLTAKGYGPDSPVADNSSTSGRAENRRVELHILER